MMSQVREIVEKGRAAEGRMEEDGTYLCVDARALVVHHVGAHAERLHREPQAFDAFKAQNLVQGLEILLLGLPLVTEWKPRQVLGGRVGVQELLAGRHFWEDFPVAGALVVAHGLGRAHVGSDDGRCGRDVGSHLEVVGRLPVVVMVVMVVVKVVKVVKVVVVVVVVVLASAGRKRVS